MLRCKWNVFSHPPPAHALVQIDKREADVVFDPIRRAVDQANFHDITSSVRLARSIELDFAHSAESVATYDEKSQRKKNPTDAVRYSDHHICNASWDISTCYLAAVFYSVPFGSKP